VVVTVATRRIRIRECDDDLCDSLFGFAVCNGRVGLFCSPFEILNSAGQCWPRARRRRPHVANEMIIVWTGGAGSDISVL